MAYLVPNNGVNINWLKYAIMTLDLGNRLASLHDENNKAIFSSVIVVTDRTVLDAQLQATISGFDHMHPYLPLIWQPCWIRFEQNTTTIYKEES